MPSNTNVTCTGTDTVGSRAGTGTTNVTITVESDATVTRNQGDSERVLSVYSNSQITNNGSLSSNGEVAAGMEARSDGNTLTNNGAISTTGASGYGFRTLSDSSGNLATNNGTITTSGQDADGFHIRGTGHEAINNGEINLIGIESDGMDSVGSGHRLTNIGTITTNPPSAANQDSDGMTVDGNNNTLVNSGTITVNGRDSNAFDIVGNNNEATNSNTLTALGPNGAAIYINGAGNSVTNSGLAEAQGATGNAAFIDSVAGENNTLVNTATGTLTSQQTMAVLGLAGNETVDNAGSIVSGSGPALDLGAGNDQLTIRGGSLQGTGAFVVNLGAGDDTTTVLGGVVMGAVNQGDGADAFMISGGTVTGNVQQGTGIDDFQMTGGQIQSLNQGDALDTFFMSDGRIVDSFEDGDHAVMTGGRIGRVNMKLDDNLFDMSGGTIDGNLVTGFGNDTIILSDGLIGGNISVSGGTDSVTVTGSTVGGEVRMSVGTDTFTWDGGGIIYGLIDLGGDNDTASLSNLTNANIGATPQITGGLGTDALTFNNVKTGDVARFDSWESIDLTNDTQLIFDETLTLGDSGTGTGSLTVDAASTIFGGQANSGIAAFTAGQFVEVVNSGRIDLTNGGDGATDTFSIGGNYAGDGGQIFLNTVLGDDSSTSDRLIVEGDASGATGLNIINAGGTGDTTIQDGIMVVEVAGTSADGAFALNSRVAAGAYEYFLFKGGVSANTEDNWYLRSAIVTPPAGPPPEPAPAPDPATPAPPEPEPEEPEIAAPPPPSELPDVPLPSEGDPTTEPVDPTPPVDVSDPEPEAPPEPPPAEPADPPPPPPAVPTKAAPVGGTATPPTPGATPVIAEVVPLYRIEVPTYAVVPPVAHYLALSTLGTFHERRGEQVLLHGGGWLPTSWGRVFGQSAEMEWSGTVAPSFDGSLVGFQVGQDLFGWESENGHHDRVGLFLAHTNMDGDVKGQALGWNDVAVGDIDVGGTSFGGYWTHVGPQGWYVDGILMGTWYSGDATSSSNVGIDIDGSGITASLEGGYPFALTPQWTLEPQAQLIWNHLSLDDQRDRFSSVIFDSDDVVTGRLGLRLQGKFETGMGVIQPYLKANLWHNFSADQTIRFDDDPIITEIGGTSLELGGGIVTQFTEKVSLFAITDYTFAVDGEKTEIFEGNIGLSIKW